ncbi:MAG TPA: S-adenosylmethionine decarboxylase [Candidatus Peribacteraceae bacterium]|nr:S-adenosylmethionine decarboxylase [Candidatus Peribacteraceae bacterium]
MQDAETVTGELILQHEMFILDAYLKKALNQSNMDEITRSLINDLLSTLGMEELGPLQIYPAADLRAPGWSFIQPITTSHISGHYFEEANKPSHLHMDIYSCKSFEWQEVIDLLDKHLSLTEWNANFIQREDDLNARKVIALNGTGSNLLSKTNLTRS